MTTIGRGRLSSFELLPPECEGLIAQAAGDLAERSKTQLEIYQEFVSGCEALMKEHRGELEFAIPSFSSFNRFSMRRARLSRRLDETRAIVATLAEKFDAKASDDLTVITGETIKALVLHMLGDAADGIQPLAAMQLATAFKAAAQAQHISSDRRRKIEKDFAEKVETAVDAVAKKKGMTAETADAIKAQILGVKATADDQAELQKAQRDAWVIAQARLGSVADQAALRAAMDAKDEARIAELMTAADKRAADAKANLEGKR